MKKLIVLLSLSMIVQFASAQENTTIFGFSIKPIFPSAYFRTGTQDITNKGLKYSLTQRAGFSGGALVRHGFTKRVSGETGILYSKRLFDFTLANDSGFSNTGSFKIVGYEIPLTAQVFIQLGEKLYMNTALGGSIDYFPSDVFTKGDRYLQFAGRTHSFNTGVNAFVGFEWREPKVGYFYLGAAYHRSLNSVYTNIIEYYPDNKFEVLPQSSGRSKLQGDYFTVDLRYYFYEPAEKKKK